MGVPGDYLLADLVGFVGGITVNYQLNVRWVFTVRRLDNRAHEFVVFAAIGLISLAISQLSLWGLVGQAGLHRDLAKGLVRRPGVGPGLRGRSRCEEEEQEQQSRPEEQVAPHHQEPDRVADRGVE